FMFTLTALDAFGNTATGYLGTVHFTSSDAAAVLPANYKFVAADAGMHAFTATLNTVGTQSLTGTDTVRNTISGTQSGILVAQTWPDQPQEDRIAEPEGIRDPQEEHSADPVVVALLQARTAHGPDSDS